MSHPSDRDGLAPVSAESAATPSKLLQYVVVALALINAVVAIICGVLDVVCGDFCNETPRHAAEFIVKVSVLGVFISSCFLFGSNRRLIALRVQVYFAVAIFSAQQIHSGVIDALTAAFVLQFALLTVAAMVWKQSAETWIYGVLLLLSPAMVWVMVS